MKMDTGIRLVLDKMGQYVISKGKMAANAFRSGLHNIARVMRCIGAKIVGHKEEMGYYAVLTLVLIALGAAANDYRSKKVTDGLIASLPTQEPVISVQSKPDQTRPPEKEKKAYILPVQGTVAGGFSSDALKWSTTLQLWQTHPAIDIAAAAGEAVLAAADGMVTEAYSDALYGNVIVIEHDDHSVMRYSSLNTLKLIQVGQHVRQGDIISSVGTCDAEADLGSHIHLEYFVNQQPEDFLHMLEADKVNGLQN